MVFGWDDVQDIAEALVQAHPEVDPLDVRLTDLHEWIIELPDFDGDPNAVSEARLEEIQKAWSNHVEG